MIRFTGHLSLLCNIVLENRCVAFYFESKMPITANLSTHSKLSPSRRRSLLVSVEEFSKSFHEASCIGDRKKVKKLLLYGNFSSFITTLIVKEPLLVPLINVSSVFSNINSCILSPIIISRSRVNGKITHLCMPTSSSCQQMLLYGAQGLGPCQIFLPVLFFFCMCLLYLAFYFHVPDM